MNLKLIQIFYQQLSVLRSSKPPVNQKTRERDQLSSKSRDSRKRERMGFMGQWRTIAKEALDSTALVAKFLCLLHVTNTYLCSSTLVYGPSMLPTLNLTGDVVLAEHLSQRLGKVSPGDVVLVRSPLNPKKTLTKRVVGVEGDTVTFFADGDRWQTTVVPKGHVWIQGDNIYASKDSRHFGPIPYGLIRGKVFLRVWPLDDFGYIGQ